MNRFSNVEKIFEILNEFKKVNPSLKLYSDIKETRAFEMKNKISEEVIMKRIKTAKEFFKNENIKYL